MRSSKASLGHCCRPHCRILVVSPPIPSRNGPVQRGDMPHFIGWCSAWPSEPFSSIRRWLLAVHKAKKAWNSHLLCLGTRTKTLGLVMGFGKWYTAFAGIAHSLGSSFAFMTCTLSPQRYFHYLVFRRTELKLRLETVNFLCWGLMELEPVIGGVVMQNLQCKLEDGTRYVSMWTEPGLDFVFKGDRKSLSLHFYPFLEQSHC